MGIKNHPKMSNSVKDFRDGAIDPIRRGPRGATRACKGVLFEDHTFEGEHRVLFASHGCREESPDFFVPSMRVPHLSSSSNGQPIGCVTKILPLLRSK